MRNYILKQRFFFKHSKFICKSMQIKLKNMEIRSQNNAKLKSQLCNITRVVIHKHTGVYQRVMLRAVRLESGATVSTLFVLVFRSAHAICYARTYRKKNDQSGSQGHYQVHIFVEGGVPRRKLQRTDSEYQSTNFHLEKEPKVIQLCL